MITIGLPLKQGQNKSRKHKNDILTENLIPKNKTSIDKKNKLYHRQVVIKTRHNNATPLGS